MPYWLRSRSGTQQQAQQLLGQWTQNFKGIQSYFKPLKPVSYIAIDFTLGPAPAVWDEPEGSIFD